MGPKPVHVRKDAAVLVYDGDCGFCTSSARWLERRARHRVEVTAWQHADLAGLGLTEAECATAVQIVGPNGHASGGAAVSEALRLCSPPWPVVGAVLGWPPVAPLVERVYRQVAANRHRLPGATCVVPSAAPASDRDERQAGRAAGERPGPSLPPPQR